MKNHLLDDCLTSFSCPILWSSININLMIKHTLLLAATLLTYTGSQAQILNRLKNKVNNAVNNSIDKSVDKVIDKTVRQPIDNTVDKALTTQASSPGQPDKTGQPATAGNKTAPPAKSDTRSFTATSFPAGATVVDRPNFLATDHLDNLYVTDRKAW